MHIFSNGGIKDRLRQYPNRLTAFFCAVLALALTGCEQLQYYHQAATGQLQLMGSRTPVARLLADSETDPALRRQLELAQDILGFAQQKMGMPHRGKYQSYVALADRYVVWNVFASPALAFASPRWCYPIVGCTPYRGFFDKEDAEQFAGDLGDTGYETYIGGVSAYSTLGWFKDPLLSSFLSYPPADLAELLFHELAHAQIWAPGDAVFNESLADFVGTEGARQWLLTDGTDGYRKLAVWLKRQQQWEQMKQRLLELKDRLSEVYGDVSLSDDEKLLRKRDRYAEFRQCYNENRADLGGGRFDRLVSEGVNNAFLVSLATYTNWREALQIPWRDAQQDWTSFFASMQLLEQLPHEKRQQQLERWQEEARRGVPLARDDQHTDYADDPDAKEVQC